MVLGLFITLLMVMLSRSALAHEEETREANLLVLQSVSLIANGAGAEVVAERLSDALAAPDTEGTDLAKVRQALTLVGARAAGERGKVALEDARRLLVASIDIRAATGYGNIPEPGGVGRGAAPYATGAETGTTVVLDELRPARGISDGGDAALLAFAVLALVVGAYLSRRWRPPDTIRELRQHRHHRGARRAAAGARHQRRWGRGAAGLRRAGSGGGGVPVAPVTPARDDPQTPPPPINRE